MSEHEIDDAPGAQLALFGAPGLMAMGGIIGFAAWYGFTGIVLLASLVAATGLVARGWAYLSLAGLHYDRGLSASRVFPGDVVTLRAVLDNRKPLPLSWVQVSESLPTALAPADDPLIQEGDTEDRRVLKFATPLGWYRSATLTREIACRRRGYHRIGPATLSSADVFGLFIKTREAVPAERLVIYPRLYPVADLGLPARQPLGGARDPQRLFDDPGRPMGLRPYTPETPFKAIAWKATARSGAMQARVYEPTVTLNTALFLAVDSFPREQDDDAFELAVSAVASIADHELSNRRATGIFANGALTEGNGPLVLPPARAPDQRTLILDYLARLERKPTGDFASFLETSLSASASRATLAVIGSRFSDGMLEQLREHRRRGRPIVLLVAGDVPLPQASLPCRRVGTLLETAAA